MTRPSEPDVEWWTTASWSGRSLASFLAQRDIGVLFQFLKSRGFSRSAIAALTGLAENRVSAISKGRQKVTAYEVLVRICEGLSIPRDLMGVGLSAAATRHETTDRIAICGSRQRTTDTPTIDAAVAALSHVFHDGHAEIRHGPRGVGLEVVTQIANHFRPRHLKQSMTIFGHANVIEGVSTVIVVGGGQGTHDEVDLAIAAGIRLLPLAASGGAARRAHALMSEDLRLREWMDPNDFATLPTCRDVDSITEIVLRITSAVDKGANRA